jgi:hypothetical protein
MRPELTMAILVVDGVYKGYNVDTVITSMNDSKHSRTSLHYSGHAVDIRTRELSMEDQEEAIEEIKQSLTNEYDVVLESNHLHIEFQPKKEVT